MLLRLIETDIKGCYFHLSQSFMRKRSELCLKNTYESNSELVLALNMVPALSFVPESKVEIGFDQTGHFTKRSRKIRRAHGLFPKNVH